MANTQHISEKSEPNQEIGQTQSKNEKSQTSKNWVKHKAITQSDTVQERNLKQNKKIVQYKARKLSNTFSKKRVRHKTRKSQTQTKNRVRHKTSKMSDTKQEESQTQGKDRDRHKTRKMSDTKQQKSQTPNKKRVRHQTRSKSDTKQEKPSDTK